MMPVLSCLRAPFVARTLPRSGAPGLADAELAKGRARFKIVMGRRGKGARKRL
jgi:hypothetical protein